jgi:hypothetical protein
VAGMKQVLLMIAVVALVGCGEKATSKVVPEKLIANPIVEEAIREALKKPTGEFTKVDLEKVRQFNLTETKITDAGLKDIAKLQNLTDLDLSRNQITDAGLKDIAKLQNLKGLDLNFTKITDAGVAKLRKALPKCDIQH